MKKVKSFFMNPWVITIGGTVIATLIATSIWDAYQKRMIFSTISSWIITVWQWILLFLNFNVKVWWLLLAALILSITIIVARKFFAQLEPEPSFLRYTKDTLLNWTWEWEWTKDYYGKYDIENLHPICPKCGMPLVNDHHIFSSAKCMRCNKSYSANDYPDLSDVKVYIIDNVRKNRF